MIKILVPIDFSKNADNAFDYAVEMFGIENTTFYVMNAFNHESSSVGSMLVSMDDVLEKDAEKETSRKVEELKKLYPGIKLEWRLQAGMIEEAVRRTNIEEKIDIVVMGTRGASGLKEVFFGSNTEKVIHSLHRPIIAVPDGYQFNGLNHIVFATDFKEVKTVDTMKPFLPMAEKFGAHIHLVSINKSTQVKDMVSESSKELIKTFMGDVKYSYHQVDASNVSKGLNEYLEKQDTDLLVMIPENRTPIQKLFGSSNTSKMAYAAKLPLMAIHNR